MHDHHCPVPTRIAYLEMDLLVGFSSMLLGKVPMVRAQGIDDNGVVVTIFTNYSNQVGALISVMHAVVRGRVRAESPLGDLGLFFGAATSQHPIENEITALSCQLNDQHILIWAGSSLAARSAGHLAASFIQGSVGRPVSRLTVDNIESYRALLGLEEEPSGDPEIKPSLPESPSPHELWVLKGWDCSDKRFKHILSMLLITPDEEQTSRMPRTARDFEGSMSLNPKKKQLLLLIEMALATFTALVLGIHPVLAMMVGRRVTRSHITSQKFASLSGALLGARVTIAHKEVYGIDIPSVVFILRDKQPHPISRVGSQHTFVTLGLLILNVAVPTSAWTVRVWLPQNALSAFVTPSDSTDTFYLVVSILYSVVLGSIAVILLFMSHNDHLLAESGFKPSHTNLTGDTARADLNTRQIKEFSKVKWQLVVWNLIHLFVAVPITALRFSVQTVRISKMCNTLVGFLGLLSVFLYSTISAQSVSCRLRATMWDSYAAFASYAFMVLVFGA